MRGQFNPFCLIKNLNRKKQLNKIPKPHFRIKLIPLTWPQQNISIYISQRHDYRITGANPQVFVQRSITETRHCYRVTNENRRFGFKTGQYCT